MANETLTKPGSHRFPAFLASFDRHLAIFSFLVGVFLAALQVLLPSEKTPFRVALFAAPGFGVIWLLAIVRPWFRRLPTVLSLSAYVVVGASLGASAGWLIGKMDRMIAARPTDDAGGSDQKASKDGRDSIEAGPPSGIGNTPAQPSAGQSHPEFDESTFVASVADAVDKKLRATGKEPSGPSPAMTGPFPPFSLGGSLERADLFDVILSGYPGREVWRTAKNPSDVKINWQDYPGTRLFVDATVRGSGFRVGLLDVDNQVTVVSSPWIGPNVGDADWGSLPAIGPTNPEELRHIIFPVEASMGTKTYRLVAQPAQRESFPSTFWFAGAITFESFSLGGSILQWFTPVDSEHLRGPVPAGTDATLDWALVRFPITLAVVEIQLRAQNAAFQTDGKVRAIVRDLSDGTDHPTDWISSAWYGGMMSSKRPRQTLKTLRLTLPQSTGVHRYRIEVEVSAAHLQASASARILLRH